MSNGGAAASKAASIWPVSVSSPRQSSRYLLARASRSRISGTRTIAAAVVSLIAAAASVPTRMRSRSYWLDSPLSTSRTVDAISAIRACSPLIAAVSRAQYSALAVSSSVVVVTGAAVGATSESVDESVAFPLELQAAADNATAATNAAIAVHLVPFECVIEKAPRVRRRASVCIERQRPCASSTPTFRPGVCGAAR